MPEKWVSQNEYMKIMGIGFNAVKHLIATGQVETRCTGSHIKIKVGGDTVSRQLYEEEKAKRIKAETMLENLRNLLKVGV